MARVKMSMNDRARQFLPFDALKGLSDAIKLKDYEHEKIQKGELSSWQCEMISSTLAKINDEDEVELQYFFDGYYKTIKGKCKLNMDKYLLLIDGKEISFDDIHDIKILNEHQDDDFYYESIYFDD